MDYLCFISKWKFDCKYCTNRAESPVFIGILRSVVLLQHCTNTTLTLHMHCLQSKALQLQHYNKSMPILKK